MRYTHDSILNEHNLVRRERSWRLLNRGCETGVAGSASFENECEVLNTSRRLQAERV